MPSDPVYVQLLDELLDLHYTKSAGYGTGSDPLANFTAIAAASGEPAWRYPRRRALEKLARIESLEHQGRILELEEEHLDVASLMLCAEVLRRRRAVLADTKSTTSSAEEPAGALAPGSGHQSCSSSAGQLLSDRTQALFVMHMRELSDRLDYDLEDRERRAELGDVPVHEGVARQLRDVLRTAADMLAAEVPARPVFRSDQADSQALADRLERVAGDAVR
jgi:hypothetical protein